MARRLLTAPMMHKIDPGVSKLMKKYLKDVLPTDFFERLESTTNESIKTLFETVNERIKKYDIDAVFFEGWAHEESVDKMSRGDYDSVPYSQEWIDILKLLREGGGRFEKTEDGKAYNFSYIIVGLQQIFPGSQFLRRMLKLSVNRRDSRMGRNISNRLGDGETGVVFYGALHNPGGYARHYGPDITVTPLYDRGIIERELRDFLMQYVDPSDKVFSSKLLW